jgi:uncharacterized protein with gpF-like domain
MKKELELKFRKILQDQRNAGKITKRQYNNELNFIKKLKETNENSIEKTNRPKTTIQMVQKWSTSITTIPTYQFRENRTR